MGHAAAYGQRHGKFLHLPDAPRSLIARSLRGIQLAATETRHDNPEPGLSGQFPSEDAYLVSLKLRDYPDCECWERGRCVTKADVRAGATYLYDLKRDPDCLKNLVDGPSSQASKQALQQQMIAELKAQEDPRMFGRGQVFEEYPYADAALRGFYERYMRGEKLQAGWVNPSDFAPEPLND
jgi:hypothetical protein